jgi:hypothetical protein
MTEIEPRLTTTFAQAVSRFLETATWLDDSHLPSVMALRGLAADLDREPTAALYAQFGLYHRSLLKAKPLEPTEVNPFEELLRR